MSTLQTWPLQATPPLTAYTTNGLNLLTSGQWHNREATQKLQLAAPVSALHFYTPHYLSQPHQYMTFNRAFLNGPFGQYGYTTGQQHIPQVIASIPTITPKFSNNGEETTTTKRPKIKEREPTTRKPQGMLQLKPPKLQIKPEKLAQDAADFKSDITLLKAVAQINPEYVIEDVINVPGKHVLSTKDTENIKNPQIFIKSSTQLATERQQQQIQLITKPATVTTKEPVGSSVKVEATGKTSTKGNIPQIPFGTYFLPYFSQNQIDQQQSNKKTAALILEPHSKAIVGNGGTAISTPISKAYLKRGVTTNVYFNPESVAIAGVGGKAHAQADLELDLIN